jgi:hypothetical protein
MKLMSTWATSRRLLLLIALIFLSVPAATRAATDPCALVKPEEISKAFGETVGAPDRVATPAGRAAGPSAACTYKGKTLEVTINAFEYLTADKSAQGWEIRRTRDLAGKRAVDLPGVGDSAYYRRDSIQSHQGIHDYNFSVVASGASANKDWKDALVAIARLFYSRLK